MEFDFKKARKDKHRQHKAAKAAHNRHRPEQKVVAQDKNDRAKPGGHATPLKPQQDAASYTATDPEQFQHLKRETDDIAALTESKSFSRRVVVSNWERYELPPDSPEEAADVTLDFETIVNSLSDAKGHMRFRHEQTWGSERPELEETFFNIDMHKLSLSLEKVPFHVRQNLPAELFTAEQLAAFVQDAEEAAREFRMKISKSKMIIEDEPQLQKDSASNRVTPFVDRKVPSNDVPLTPLVTADSTNATSKVASNEDLNSQNPNSTSLPTAREEQISAPVSSEVCEEKRPIQACATSSKVEELDLDFLLSLDEAVPEAPKLPPRVETPKVNAVTNSQGPNEIKQLDDWLDDLLDD